MLKSLQLHCVQHGHGYPVFCLHGFAEDMSTWDRMVNLFNNNPTSFGIYSIDFVGHGKSPRPHESGYYNIGYIVETIHNNIQQQLKTTGFKKYALLGYSLGGRMATYYALKYCNELTALILESASFGIKDMHLKQERKSEDEKLAELIEKNNIDFFEQYWSKLSLFHSQKALPAILKAEIKRRRLQNDPKCLAQTLRMLGQGSLNYTLDDILALQLPKLYIGGALDEKYVAIARDLQTISAMPVYIVEQAGHNVHLEQPDTYYQIVHNFITSQHNKLK